jgi:hypothetical protein
MWLNQKENKIKKEKKREAMGKNRKEKRKE